jgi:Family of unknown function (DUF6807)
MRDSFVFPRVQALPGLERASLRVAGVERVGYEFGLGEARPFLYPVVGPSGALLTRLGHPNPVGDEHHMSVCFGHEKVNGTNFWEVLSGTDVAVRHRRVVLYQDGPDWAGLVAELDWWAHGQVQIHQRLIIVLEPRDDGGYALDLQSRFEAPSGPVELGKTDRGFLGVRIAKTISEQFGGGRLTSSEGLQGGDTILGSRASWVDYSGPSAPGVIEGITYFDHPENPGHPTFWHVSRDGWMGAAFNVVSSTGLASGHPIDVRYRLLVHSGPANPAALDSAWNQYTALAPYIETPARAQNLAALARGTPTG